MQSSTIERAVFTSVQTERLDGYQLAAASPGLSSQERDELAGWGPAHDALLDSHETAVSLNFHRLAGGRFSVSRTMHAGEEYSGRGGWRVYTQFLLVQPETLARFANNPFRLLEAAVAAGYMEQQQPLPQQLEPIQLVGGATMVDHILLARLARHPGPQAMGALVEASLADQPLAIVSRTPLARLLAGLFSLLPVEVRPEFSFTTALKPSSQRGFRLQPAQPDALRSRGRRRPGQPALLDVDDVAARQAVSHPWAELAQRVLGEGCLSKFCASLRSVPDGLSRETLGEVAQSVGAALARSSRSDAAASPAGAG